MIKYSFYYVLSVATHYTTEVLSGLLYVMILVSLQVAPLLQAPLLLDVIMTQEWTSELHVGIYAKKKKLHEGKSSDV